MPRFSGNKNNSSNSKRHFTLVKGNKEHGLFYGSTPSAAALMVATKLLTSSKSKKSDIVEFNIREITQGSKKKVYGPYIGYIDKLKPIKADGHEIQRSKIVAKLKKVGMKGGSDIGKIEISYGDCGKKHFYSRKTASNKCIILSLGVKRITIGSHGSTEIQVKYFNNISSVYDKKEIYKNKIFNYENFNAIITELIATQPEQNELLGLINKILSFIKELGSPNLDIYLIEMCLTNARTSMKSNTPGQQFSNNSIVSATPAPKYIKQQSLIQSNTLGQQFSNNSIVSAPPPPPPPPPAPTYLPPSSWRSQQQQQQQNSAQSTSSSAQPQSTSSSASPPRYLNNIARAAEQRRLRREAEAIGPGAAVTAVTSEKNMNKTQESSFMAELRKRQQQRTKPFNLSRINNPGIKNQKNNRSELAEKLARVREKARERAGKVNNDD